MTRDMTLSAAIWGGESLLGKVLMVILGSAFIAVAAQISVPMWPVPITLQMLAILLVGFAYGARLGAVTLVAYLAQGAAGAPVFASGNGGLVYMAGPTLGFLLGFVFVAWAAGWAAERGWARGLLGTALCGLVISALLYVPGILWPITMAGLLGVEGGWVGQDFGSYYWAYFIEPFLLGDAIKAVVAAMLVTGAWKALKARQ